MFGSLGLPELLLIFFVILVVFGPRRLPEIGKTLGKALGEFKKASDELKNTIEREVRLEELKRIVPAIPPVDVVSRTEPSPAAEVAPAADVAPAAEVAAAAPPPADAAGLAETASSVAPAAEPSAPDAPIVTESPSPKAS